jgi:zinc/manganese transport system ATP-binding protein
MGGHLLGIMSIHVKNLTVSYRKHPIVHHISGSFASGSSTAIVGPNGSGKSTLLKAMMGMISIDSGEVILPESSVAYLPQRSEIDSNIPMSVYDLVSTGLWQTTGAWGAVDAQGRWVIERALSQVGLADFANHSMTALSSGQFQRMLFARLLVQDASLIILDEPFNTVDEKTTTALLGIIKQWQKQGRTIIAVLHDFAQVRTYFPYTLLLAHEVVAWDKTELALTSPHVQLANERCAHWQERGAWCEVT